MVNVGIPSIVYNFKLCSSIELLAHFLEKTSKTEKSCMTDTTYVDGWLVSLTYFF